MRADNKIVAWKIQKLIKITLIKLHPRHGDNPNAIE